jgi:hypothetical protein
LFPLIERERRGKKAGQRKREEGQEKRRPGGRGEERGIEEREK